MDKAPLVADIVSTWLERGQDRPTLVFAVNRAHAKHIEQQFQAAGVTTGYLDAYSDLEERNQIARDFEAGTIRVVCNVGVLTTGVDWDVRCIILARPTRSEILYTQIIGRGLRTAEGKDFCLILDHSDTTIKLGFVTDIIHDKLDDGRAKATVKEKKTILPKECPKCAFLKPPKTKVCPSCGFEAQPVAGVDNEEGELHELTKDGRVKVQKWTVEQKQKFYNELLGYAHLKGYKKGWAYHAYRGKFGVGPANTFNEEPHTMIRGETESWIRHYNIRKAKAREKAAGAKFDAKHPN
jgi:superfamily II DNA or RNA helicase